MKTHLTLLLVSTTLAVLAGCASPAKGPAYGHEAEFRTQLAESTPVKQYGYTIEDLRFTKDYQRALVVFTHPDHREGLDSSQRRPPWECILESDGFGRYRGMTMQPFYTPGTGSTPSIMVTVTLPHM